MYVVLFGASVLLARATWKDPAPALRGSGKARKDLFRGVVAVSCGAGGALVGANLVAFIMSSEYCLGKAMSWFSNEFSTVGLYGPAAFTGSSFPTVELRTNLDLVYRSTRFPAPPQPNP